MRVIEEYSKNDDFRYHVYVLNMTTAEIINTLDDLKLNEGFYELQLTVRSFKPMRLE